MSRPSARVHDITTRDECERVLGPFLPNDGMFVLRKSNAAPGAYGISVCHGSSISHYKIDLFPSKKYGIQDGLHYVTLQDLVDHYHEERDGLCCKITRNVLDPKPGTGRPPGQPRGAAYSTIGMMRDTRNGAGADAPPLAPARPSIRRPGGPAGAPRRPLSEPEESFNGFDDIGGTGTLMRRERVYENEAPPALVRPAGRGDSGTYQNHGGGGPPKKVIIPSHEIQRGQKIGSGEFGEVCDGKWVHGGKAELVAIKYLKNVDEESRQAFLAEADTIMGFNHRAVVGVKGLVVDGEVALVLELLPLGALNKYLKSRVGTLPVQLLTSYCAQIAEGMAYLESMKVLHRDLAARNILVKSADNVQISDFGLSRLTDTKDYYTAKSKGKWPVKWYALECIYYRKFTHKSDVWSFGVTCWEVFKYGKKPYGKLKGQQVVLLLEEGVRLPRPENCSLELYTLLMRCWNLEPKKRPSFTEIVRTLSGQMAPAAPRPRSNTNAMERLKYTMDNQKLYDTLPDPGEQAINEEEGRNHMMQQLSMKKINPRNAGYVRFDALQFLGDEFAGTFGPVKHGRYQNLPVAIRHIDQLDTFNVDMFQHEISRLTKVNSPYLVKFVGFSEHPNKSVLLLQEYVKQGPLNKYLGRARVDKTQKTRFCTQISLGMKYLEDMKVVHRDLAARNVMVSSSFTCKVSDVGLSAALSIGPEHFRASQSQYSQGGRPKGDRPAAMKWYAPESISSNIFNTKTDVWSWGVTFWEIMASISPGAGTPTPYGKQNGQQVIQILEKGQRLPIPTEFSQGQFMRCRSLLDRAWQKDPKQRPTFDEIYKVMRSVVPETTQGM